MSQVDFIPKDKGAFIIEEAGERIAEMVVDITGGELAVYHTGVNERLRGQGIGRKLIDGMSDFARQNNLKIIPYCPFVLSVLRRHPEEYDGLWEKKSTGSSG